MSVVNAMHVMQTSSDAVGITFNFLSIWMKYGLIYNFKVRIMMKFLVMAGVHGRHGPNVILLQTAERGQEFV